LTLYDASAPQKIVFLLLFQLFPACCYVAKIAGPLVGAPFFVQAPVRPNMLNMPKSASAAKRILVQSSAQHFANLLKFYPRAQNVRATFYDFSGIQILIVL